ncbi:MAG: hypothetical protein AB1553_01490 [Nitrospirota bacterium]
MKLSHFYTKAIEAGIEHDPRGKEIIQKELERVRKEYDRLSEKEKETFDREHLGNPYADSRIPFGTGDERIGTILVGIDIDVGEVLFAETLRNTTISMWSLQGISPATTWDRTFSSIRSSPTRR